MNKYFRMKITAVGLMNRIASGKLTEEKARKAYDDACKCGNHYGRIRILEELVTDAQFSKAWTGPGNRNLFADACDQLAAAYSALTNESKANEWRNAGEAFRKETGPKEPPGCLSFKSARRA